MRFPIRHALLALFLILVSNGCISSHNTSTPASPGIAPENMALSADSRDIHGRFLLDYILVAIDESGENVEIIPVRNVTGHMNVVNFLEQTPCTDCLQIITPITPIGINMFDIQVQVTHPYTNMNRTGFDVRGIVIFNAGGFFPEAGLTYSASLFGDGELLNADGYSTLYNSLTAGSGSWGTQGYIHGKYASAAIPDSILNGYKRYITDDPSNIRNAFYAGDSIIQHFEIKKPVGAFIFGYAVDASWAVPLSLPVVDPIADFGPEANSAEPWKVEVAAEPVGDGFNENGGEVDLTIDVYDWQEKSSHADPVVECFEIFDGSLTAEWLEDGADYSRYTIKLFNDKIPPTGIYNCLVSVEDNDNATSPDWLDLTAYQIVPLTVTNSTVQSDVTPSGLNHNPLDVAASGNHVYMAAGHGGLGIFDISDPTSPVTVDYLDLNAMQLVVDGAYAYVLEETGSLVIVNIADPDNAFVENTVTGLGSLGIAFENGHAYVTGSTDLYIVDVDPVGSASVVKTLPIFGNNNYNTGPIAVENGYAYLNGYYTYGSTPVVIIRHTHIYDVDPPGSAGQISYLNDYGQLAVAASGNYLYISGDDGIEVFDVTDPDAVAAPVHTIQVSPPEIMDMDISGDFIYCSSYSGSLHIVNIADPPTASVINTIPTMYIPYTTQIIRTAYTEPYAILMEQSVGFHVIDVGSPLSAEWVGSQYVLNLAKDVAIEGNHAYVLAAAGLFILDISDPETTFVENIVDTTVPCYRLEVSDGYAYVPKTGPGVNIYDVDPPSTAAIAATATVSSMAHNVAVWNDLLFTIDDTDGLCIFDISIPESPSLVKTVPALTYYASGLDVADGYAYLTVNFFDMKLQIFDVDPPAEASLVTTYNLGLMYPWDIHVNGDYAYISDMYDGLKILKISDPANPVPVKFVDTPGHCNGLDYSNGYVYLADSADPGVIADTSLIVVPVNPPSDAYMFSSIETAGHSQDVAVDGGYAYMAADDGGLRILKLW